VRTLDISGFWAYPYSFTRKGAQVRILYRPSFKNPIGGICQQLGCSRVITSSRDIDYDGRGWGYALLYDSTKMVDNSGNEYYASQIIKVGGDKSSRSNREGLNTNLVKGVTYKINCDFDEVPTSVSQITLLQFGTGDGTVLKVRNVPIN